jgi:protein TonB
MEAVSACVEEMMKRTKKSPFNWVSVSVILHLLAVALIVVATNQKALEMIRSGNTNLEDLKDSFLEDTRLGDSLDETEFVVLETALERKEKLAQTTPAEPEAPTEPTATTPTAAPSEPLTAEADSTIETGAVPKLDQVPEKTTQEEESPVLPPVEELKTKTETEAALPPIEEPEPPIEEVMEEQQTEQELPPHDEDIDPEEGTSEPKELVEEQALEEDLAQKQALKSLEETKDKKLIEQAEEVTAAPTTEENLEDSQSDESLSEQQTRVVEASEIEETTGVVAPAEPLTAGHPSGVQDARELSQTPGNLPPKYTVSDRIKGNQGVVTLTYYVTSNGRVENVKVLRSSGHPSLDEEAVKAVEKYRYVPGQEGYTIHPLEFRLKGAKQPAPSRLRTTST